MSGARAPKNHQIPLKGNKAPNGNRGVVSTSKEHQKRRIPGRQGNSFELKLLETLTSANAAVLAIGRDAKETIAETFDQEAPAETLGATIVHIRDPVLGQTRAITTDARNIIMGTT